MSDEELRFNLYPHQKVVITTKARHIAMFGGIGSGKSLSQMLRLMVHLSEFPGTEVIIGRQQKVDIERTIWRDFQRMFGSYIRNKNEQKMRITLWNGSTIHFVNLWDDQFGVQHLDGYNISAFLISQAEQVKFEAYMKLKERSRLKHVKHVSGRPIQKTDYLRLLEGNPSGKDWIYNEFMKPYLASVVTKTEKVKGKEKEYRLYSGPDSIMIQVSSDNYRFVPDDYLETISAGSERHIRRYVLGEFDNYAGLVYDNFNSDIHICEPFNIRPDIDTKRYKRYIGFDWGLRNPTAVIWLIHDEHEDVYYLYRELYVTNMIAPDVARKILELSGTEIINGMFVDPAIRQRSADTGRATWDILNDILNPKWQEGIIRFHMIAGNNDIEYGIQKVYETLQLKNGHPGMYLLKGRCPNTEDEFTKYAYPNDADENKVSMRNLKELPVDKHNHALGAIRYVIASPKPDTRVYDAEVPR